MSLAHLSCAFVPLSLTQLPALYTPFYIYSGSMILEAAMMEASYRLRRTFVHRFVEAVSALALLCIVQNDTYMSHQR